ncbi:GntR family transcriptional regulator [Proteinivorax hydrogeniformans]|uniref:GntR family transcriptional regulator n=1 Tax=Proteinivorax hydrogeniformans TaxID=1826727 RepID=A0AAU8HUL8_9FIRM
MKRNANPLYIQVKNQIKQYIADSNLVAGDILPSESCLAERYNVSRVTVRMAIKQLQKEQLVYKVKGSGTYIKELNHGKLIGFTEEVKKWGKKVDSEVLDFKVIKADEKVSDYLKVPKKDLCYYIERVRKINGESAVLEICYMPVDLFEDLSIDILEKSKYSYIEDHKKLTIDKSCQKIIPTNPNKLVQLVLGLEKESPILQVDSQAFLQNQRVFEYTIHYYHPKLYNYHIVVER